MCRVQSKKSKLFHQQIEQIEQIFCIEATAAILQARGIEVNPIKMGKEHSFQAWITDPDGNYLELYVYTPASWQAPSLA
jgi:hypothetical protein